MEVCIIGRGGQKQIFSLDNKDSEIFKNINSQEEESKMKYTKEDFTNLRNMAWEFLIANRIYSLPLDMPKIARNNGWELMPYERLNAKLKRLFKEHITQLTGFTIEADGKYFICYNQNIKTQEIRFTIAHEMGHILLNHLHIEDEHNFEQEANMFAYRLLMPLCVMKECGLTNSVEMMKLCGVNIPDAEMNFYRFQELTSRDEYYLINLERLLKSQFFGFINNIKKLTLKCQKEKY